jgi:uncharacterized membrane protein YcaP (DUF421 family)
MDSVLRAFTVYLFLLVIFRVAGKRSLSQVTTFDLVLGLIISEALQQAMIDNDDSMTNSFVVVTTLVGLNVLMSSMKQRSDRVERLLEGAPVVVFEDGALLPRPMDKERVDEADILNAGRSQHGITSLDDVDYAVVERSGDVTVMPKEGATP